VLQTLADASLLYEARAYHLGHH